MTSHRLLRLTSLIVVATMPLVGISSAASAHSITASATRGSAAWCAHHPNQAPKVPACSAAAGGSSGTAGTTGTGLTIQIDPTPDIETGQSYVDVVVQVEASPAFAGDTVDVSSSQLRASCSGYLGYTALGGVDIYDPPGLVVVPLVLDDDGNATVALIGSDCAPGSSIIEADLTVAPYLTALGTLVADPPVVTPSGVFGFPTTSGTVTTGEVETGDTTSSGNSDVYAVFTIETDPVYAEQTAEISMNQLVSRCGGGSYIVTLLGNSDVSTTPDPTAPLTTALDDDGNATFLFVGQSCAAGSSEVIADVTAGTYPTYTTTFTIEPPQPTI
jgi:hypothetical protein